MADTEGDTQMISLILPDPSKDSLRMRVSLESLTGMCVRDWTVRAYVAGRVLRCSGRVWTDCR